MTKSNYSVFQTLKCSTCLIILSPKKEESTLYLKVKSLSRVRLFATPWTIAYQASPSMGFSRQEYWNGLPFPSPGDLPDPGIKPGSPALEADALTSEHPGVFLRTYSEWYLMLYTHSHNSDNNLINWCYSHK